MGKKNKEPSNALWTGINEDDFYTERNIEPVDMASYDLDAMTIFSANVNYFRQIPRLSDSLKPVERRILYTMYRSGNKPGHKQKSGTIVTNAMILHNHGDCYSTVVAMTQRWKKPLPLIDGKGSFGTESSELYAAYRYTEAMMSKYAYECFFEDYDSDCVEQLFNTASDSYEPMSLPAKFPNILINGGIGFTVGNAFCIPPFNINDIIENCEKVMKDPECPDVFMVPDFPTGCNIVDDGQILREICDTGKGTLKIRAVINVIEKPKVWELQVTNLPWYVSLDTINSKLVALTKAGTLPIKDIKDHSYPIKLPNGSIGSKVDYRIVIDKTHDPYAIIDKLYKMTSLQKSLAVNFKVVKEELAVETLSLRELIASWIDERRSYKRRLYNKKITKLGARIDLLEILIHLLKAENIEKTLKIIKESNSDEIVPRLMKHGKMNSYQATKIADMKLSAFTKDARKKYKEEKEAKEKELKEVMEIVRSEKKIDKIILDELRDLKKYATPRKSQLVSEGSKKISQADYTLVITKLGLIKKLPFHNNLAKDANMGSFKNNDQPIQRITLNNMDNVIMIDNFGRYSIIPVHQIDTTELSHHGYNLFDIAGLNGRIVSVIPQLDGNYDSYIKSKLGKPYMVTLTEKGYIKKTSLEAYTGLRTSKNIRCTKLRDDDFVVWADILLEHVPIIIYTAKGQYISMNLDDIPEQGKDATGIIGVKLEDSDTCIGLSVLGNKDDYLVVVTEKGLIKKCEFSYLTTGKKKGSYLATLDSNDAIAYVNGARNKNRLVIFTRNQCYELPVADLPVLTRKAKCKKVVAMGQGVSIVKCLID